MNGLTNEYLLLFNAITDAEQTLTRLREELLHVQRQAEELYLLRTDPPKDSETSFAAKSSSPFA